ncbi:glycoside hydrolase family 95 protein [Sphingobacterium bovistauri]|uniref:Glycoside hydrolase family 95 protein n=1 Tax=Sphingobacterium bovistauri TaxID=2781959 RepID=A0ABS7Z6Q3_9SPHI|nr:glycoside hydrolase family 95 protein [Sphingobacterium bovistauri]MCA5004629.1 glycoside hydrolase family 95 protein [Sphingobacterium bovistauri]
MRLISGNLIMTLVFVIYFIALPGYAQQNNSLRLQYYEPADAKVWEQALPIGNGRLGAMIYGIPATEEIQLNEETIWAGGPYRNDNPKAGVNLKKIQQLVFEGKTKEADKLLNETFFTKTHGMPFQTAGSLLINFPGHDSYQKYYRELDIEQAKSISRYEINGVTYTREIFSSFSDDVIIVSIKASKKNALTFDLQYKNPARHTVSAKDNILILEGRGGDHEGIKGEVIYQTHTTVKNVDGLVNIVDNKLQVKNATSVVVYISIGTNFINYKSVAGDAGQQAESKLSAALKVNYSDALESHSKFYNAQFNTFKLDLGKTTAVDEISTTERIRQFQKTQDPSLVTLLTQFGRYLLICSSQPNGQPANLQGIWNNSLYPAWDSKYTININTEMNYWPAESTNLSHTHRPLIQMVKELSESGKETAKSLYNAEGWVAHHNTDVWRVTSPIDFAAAGMWFTGGTWLAQHLWEHYLYNGDKKYLREVYPILKSASDFLLSTLIPHPKYQDKGWMVLSPSISPEHGPMAAGVTMDNQLVFDMLTRTALANEILGEETSYRDKLRAMAKRIPPMQVGKHTQLQEWLEDVDDPKNEHRHVSHLYGLYPGNQISPYSTPALFEASRNSLRYRGDFATGWSIGWKVNLWARLLDGNHAYKIINNMLTLADKDNRDGRTYPNMFTAHPPFQIDGNFGLTAGVAEMLIQSHDGAVHVLPALPSAWKKGSVQGIKARGGFEIDMQWSDALVNTLKVKSVIGGNLRLRSYVPLKGKGLKVAKGMNKNILLNREIGATALVSNQANLKGNNLQKVYEYDIQTTAGKTYSFSINK